MPTKPTSEPSLAGPGDITESPDVQGAYPRLSEDQVAALAGQGDRRGTQPGDILFEEGERDCDFYVVLAGHVASVEGHGTREQRVISVHGRGRFLGELSLLTGEGSFYTATALDTGEVLAVPAARLGELVGRDPVFGDLILHAYLLRRSILIGLGVGLRVVGSKYSPDTRRVRDFAARNRIPARWLDLEEDPSAEAVLTQLGVSPGDTPIVIVYGRLLRNPSNSELAAAVGLPVPSTLHASCDLLVVGSGPAGLSAAVYGASEGMQVIALDGVATGGQAGLSSRIENYLGFPAGISGAELAGRATLQAQKFGARFAVPAEATAIEQDGNHYRVHLADGTSLTSACVVVATGARYRRLDVQRIDYYERTSIYYAASQAEALLCAGDPVAIVGGGNSAGQAAVFLSGHAAQVTLVVRERDLGENMSRYLVGQVTRLPNVRVILGAEVRELRGDEALEAITVQDGATGARCVVSARAMFVFIGAMPCTGWLNGLVNLDDRGFVRTGPGGRPGTGPEPLLLETSRTGIFAAGDVRSGSAKRVATAVGEGAMAIRLAFEGTRPAQVTAAGRHAPAAISRRAGSGLPG